MKNIVKIITFYDDNTYTVSVPVQKNTYYQYHYTNNKCRICGVDYSKSTGYVCGVANCPTKTTCT